MWLHKTSPDIVAHEVFHAVELLMDRIGCKLTDESSEAYAYLIGYLTKEIHRCLKLR